MCPHDRPKARASPDFAAGLWVEGTPGNDLQELTGQQFFYIYLPNLVIAFENNYSEFITLISN